MILALHHVQLAMPKGGEDLARAFYGAVLGFAETAKPAALQGRGGVWFAQNGIALHLGVEEPFAPAKKAHPALTVASLETAMAHLTARQVEFHRDIDLPGIRRIHIADPFGNRIELLELR